MNKQKIFQIAKYIWGIGIAAAAAYFIIANYSTAQLYFRQISSTQFTISIGLQILARFLLIELIRQSVIRANWSPRYEQIFSLVSISQLGKYIPGGVWQFVARFGAYKENNMTNKDMGKSFLIENIWMVAGAFFTGLFFMLIRNPGVILANYNISLSPVVKGILAAACLLVWFGSFLVAEIKLYPAPFSKELFRSSMLFITQGIMWLMLGASFYILFSNASLDNFWYIVGAYTISFLAGYVAIFAPGGIGVREVVSVFLLAPIFTSAEVGVVTIVHRLLYTLVEFAFAAAAYAISGINKVRTLKMDRKQE